MTDTPPEILKKQFEIFFSKPIQERFRMQIEMMESSVRQAKSLLMKRFPSLSEKELNVEFFKFYYRDSFSNDEMEKIVAWMKS